MKVTRTSIISGKTTTRDLDITSEQIMKHSEGAFVQDAFPHLSAEDREFIISGITPEEWAEVFGAVE